MPSEKINRIRILFLASNPADTPLLNLTAEISQIREKVKVSGGRELIELISRQAVCPDDLLQALNEDRPHIVHFSGHGDSKDGIILEDKQGRSKIVDKDVLRRLFSAMSDNIRLVVLNACFSEEQATTLVETIDCAIGSKKELIDEDAIVFSASFYRAISFGRSIQEAFDQGKLAVSMKSPFEENAFSLITRKGVDASNIILVSDQANRMRPFDPWRDSGSIERFYRKN